MRYSYVFNYENSDKAPIILTYDGGDRASNLPAAWAELSTIWHLVSGKPLHNWHQDRFYCAEGWVRLITVIETSDAGHLKFL